MGSVITGVALVDDEEHPSAVVIVEARGRRADGQTGGDGALWVVVQSTATLRRVDV